MAMASSKSEDILGEKWDRCVADTLIKIGGAQSSGLLFTARVNFVVSYDLQLYLLGVASLLELSSLPLSLKDASGQSYLVSDLALEWVMPIANMNLTNHSWSKLIK
ncbi:uncharacterized protein LOC125030644 isoform X1 [Penaeus chinensis]|uniref:uncharacterized protein LOC125030644 isoform X1 n=1 Tax=Penaeus chinensis TaxID=139456 RepID=UPI001FB7F62E|nr:uncharacterized protein LOC125030644 isoform X1 [Penaeus chinensis]XP_047476776.1 uncharacterized protein LOC125030644 isoform X1 [Penaeus chinensis]